MSISDKIAAVKAELEDLEHQAEVALISAMTREELQEYKAGLATKGHMLSRQRNGHGSSKPDGSRRYAGKMASDILAEEPSRVFCAREMMNALDERGWMTTNGSKQAAVAMILNTLAKEGFAELVERGQYRFLKRK